MSVFQPSEILLPHSADKAKWAVIACDQFTSEPDYWRRVRENAKDAPSAINLILPESELGLPDEAQKIETIHETMRRYLENDVFAAYPDSFIYVERTLLSGAVRRGVVGQIDLTAYDYTAGSTSRVRATEKTVVERIPPRLRVREGASLELPHVLLLCDDAEKTVIEPLSAEDLPTLYDFELMEGGGHIRGKLVSGEAKTRLVQRIAAYENAHPALTYAVGDGNHSLATAKAAQEKGQSRYALVELENVRDDALVFEPIHRIVTETDVPALLTALEKACGAPDGFAVGVLTGKTRQTVTLDRTKGELAVAVLQSFLDDWLKTHAGKLDYIHGEAAVQTLAAQKNAVGFLLPAMEKAALFRGVERDGVLPRKTFSMGHAQEKRYYLEARRIV
ncbi:MAG: DUF1015 domain-containing protein [Oscillospiraceae bacterium]|nr:DUF1015 domain-containing protein [Oscillospiraceae bacterium]